MYLHNLHQLYQKFHLCYKMIQLDHRVKSLEDNCKPKFVGQKLYHFHIRKTSVLFQLQSHNHHLLANKYEKPEIIKFLQRENGNLKSTSDKKSTYKMGKIKANFRENYLGIHKIQKIAYYCPI